MTTATITRPADCIAPKTGLTGYKQHRCRCGGCLAANRNYNNLRFRLIAYGRWEPLVDAEPARQHIRALGKHGLGWQRVAELASVSEGTVSHILYSKGGRPPVSRIRRETADAILAIKASVDAFALGQCIDATGTRRRTQALAALGWSVSEQGRRLGRTAANHKLVLTTDTVQVRTADMVKRLYEELSATPPPPGFGVTRTKRWAQRNGFPPPLAWEGVDIDDPDAQPVLEVEPADDDTPDPITVGLAIDGRLTYQQLAAHRPDLIEVVRRLAAAGMGDGDIAHHLRWPGAADGVAGKTRGQGAVCKLRNREGIPAPEKYEAVYAYRPGGRRARNDKAA